MGKRQRARLREGAPVGGAEVFTGDLVDLDETTLRATGNIPVKVITPGWGTSGYYSPEVLERDGAAAFPAGTHMYWDHPGTNDEANRPERSLRDLAGTLAEAATWRPDGPDGPGLYAEAKVFDPFRPLLAEMAPHIGVSIRASGHAHTGEADGRTGKIVDRLIEGRSVDFVTKAGRGGKVLAFTEALRDLNEARNVGQWFEARIHADFTQRADDMFGNGQLTREERIALSSGIGAALDAFAQTVEQQAPQLLTRDLWDEPSPADAPTITESKEGDMPDDTKLQETVATLQTRLATLEESTTKADERANLAEARADRAEEALVLREAADYAKGKVADSRLPDGAQTRIVEAVTANPAKTDDGKLDRAKLDEAIKSATDAEVKYLTDMGVKVSPVVGLGEGAAPVIGDTPPTADQIAATEARIAKGFERLGMSESAAKTAAAGR